MSITKSSFRSPGKPIFMGEKNSKNKAILKAKTFFLNIDFTYNNATCFACVCVWERQSCQNALSNTSLTLYVPLLKLSL